MSLSISNDAQTQLLAALVSGPVVWGMSSFLWKRLRTDPKAAAEARKLNAEASTAEAKRGAAELERLLAEIARLDLERKDREALVELLRHELEKALVRGNSSLTMARILLFAVDQEQQPSAAMIAARAQARDVINAADEQMKRGN